ncbi:MAG: MFS transporter [Pseudomonadota bacterium]
MPVSQNTQGTLPSPSAALTACVLAVSSLTVLANATIAPSLPGLALTFADTPRIETLAALVLTLPSLAVVLTAGLFGWVADRFDGKSVLIAAMLAYAIGGASGAMADTMGQILAGRFVLGLGVAGTLTVATQLAAAFWHGLDRARFMGWQGAAISATGIASLLLGGLLAGLDWRGPFLIYLAAFPLAAAAWIVVPARSGAVLRQTSTPAAFPWRVLALTGGLMFAAMAFIMLAGTRLPFLLGDIGVASPGLIGVTLAAMTLASFPTGLFYGRARARLEPCMIAAISFALMGSGFAFISQAHTLPVAILGILVCGSGLGLIIPNQNVWLMAHVPESQRGRAAGLMTTCLFAGQFVSPLISGVLLAVLNLHVVFLVFAVGAGLISAGLWAFSGARTSRMAGDVR